MPVRIIFRGLILFHFPKPGETNAGKLVACLINNPELTGGFENASQPHKEHGRHEHHHSAEIQVLARGYDPKPVLLPAHADVDMLVLGDSHKPVSTASSFDDHVPDLETIIAKGTDAIRNAGRNDADRRPELIQNVVTVDRGVAHVKNVINWDQDGYPLSGNRAERGGRPGAPVQLKFMGSSVRGHMASEVVVETDEATEIELRSTSPQKDFNGKRKGHVLPNHRGPLDTVDVLVTNYEFRRDGPVAWGLDYQWLFETVGYGAAELAGPEFDGWRAFARNYDPSSFDSETALLLRGGPNNPVGRPFPYIASADSLALLRPLTDDYNPPVCAFGKTRIGVP